MRTPFTNLEQDIMATVWQRGSATGSAPETNVHLQPDEAAGTVAVTLDLGQEPAQ